MNSITRIAVAMILLLSINIYGQDKTSSNLAEFYQYIAEREAHFANEIRNNNGSTEGIYGYKNFQRWKNTYMEEGHNDEGMANVLSGRAYFNRNMKSIMQNTNTTLVEWEELGPVNKPINYLYENYNYIGPAGVGRVFFVEFDPNNSNRVFIGSPTGGLYYSTDHGESWTNGGTDQLPEPGVSHFKMVPASKSNNETWFILTGDRDNNWSYTHGVYRSIDQGLSWKKISTGISIGDWTTGIKFLQNPTASNEMIAIFSSGMFKTTNILHPDPDAVIWTEVPEHYFNEDHFTDICYQPNSNYQNIYASTREGIYKSIDGGSSFLPLPNLQDIDTLGNKRDERRITLRTTVANSNILYAAIITKDGGSKSKLYKYPDSTGHWEQKGLQLPYQVNPPYGPEFESIGYGRYQSFLVSSIDDDMLYYSRVGFINKSDNGGETWENLTNEKHDDTHWICFENGDPSKIWLGTDGGVYYTENDFVDIEDKTYGIGIASIENVAISEKSPNTFVIGTWDCGSMLFKPEVNEWGIISGGDGFDALINDNNLSDLYYHTSSNDAIPQRFDDVLYDRGDYWWDPGPLSGDTNINPNGFHHTMINDYQDKNIIYYPGRKRVGRSIDNGVTWEEISELSHETFWVRYWALENTKSNRDILYVSKIRNEYADSIPDDFKILKTTNCRAPAANVTWQDISPYINNSYYRQWCGDMAINDDNPDEIWATFAGYSKEYKVLHYKNNAWQDITGDANNTLQHLSVKQIAWVGGGDNMLLIGTNCGVYYKSDLVENWTKIEGMPNVRIMELEVQRDINKFVVATYSRGLWRGSLPCVIPGANQNITSNTTWNTDQLKAGNVYIKQGAKLTISNCKIQFAPGKKLIVEQGAELIIQNATLDSRCAELWGGIEVWGNSNLNQSYTNQGAVRTYTGTKIKNAICGIRALKYTDEPVVNTGGGIVIAQNTEFINNKVGISIPYYSRFSNGNLIKNCKFIITDNIKQNMGSVQGIYLAVNTSISITDNEFLFENSNENLQLNSIAIKNFGGSAIINKTARGNTFNAWGYGVYASSLFGADHLSIKENNFIDCNTGVYISGQSNSEIVLNDFDIPNMETNSTHHAGLYLDNCYDFTVEENTFHSRFRPGNPVGEPIGLVINNSGAHINEVYKNDFERLKYAILAQKQNRASNGDGLTFKCNTFNLSGYDISVVDPVNYTGIGQYQGSGDTVPTAPAGNQFSYTGPTGTPTDINNEEQQIIYYYHNENNYDKLKPKFYINTTPLHNVQDWDIDTCCPSNYTNSGGGLEEAKSRMASFGESSESLGLILASLEDGGNTAALQSEVDNSTPPETMEVYTELMTTSPYLSDTVVESAIYKENVLPNAMIRDVMVANPQSAKNNELLTAVEDRANPMPEYMKAQILQGKSIIGAMEQLMAEHSHHKQIYNQAFKQCVSFYLNDTINTETNMDSLISLLNREHRLEAKYKLVALNLQEGNHNEAQLLMDNIENQFNLTSNQLAEYNHLQDYLSISSQWQENDFDFNNLTENQLSELDNLEFNANGLAKVYARNIRLELGASNYKEPYILPDVNKSTQAQLEEEKIMESLEDFHYIKLFPNPAKNYIIVEYQLENKLESAMLQISHISGKILKEIPINEFQNQETIDIRELKSGNYIISLFSNGKVLESSTFNIVK